MNDCIICYERANNLFQPEFKPIICNCKYTIHQHCYNSWLESTGVAYNCMMCRAKVTHEEAAKIKEMTIGISIGVFKRVLYISLCYFIVVYYKEILLIALLWIILVDRNIVRAVNYIDGII